MGHAKGSNWLVSKTTVLTGVGGDVEMCDWGWWGMVWEAGGGGFGAGAWFDKDAGRHESALG